MAGLGFKDFQVGEVLTSADVDGYLMQQSVMRFADSGARGSALGTAPGTAVALAEGMVSYLDDSNTVQVYSGSAWVGIGNFSASTAITATDASWSIPTLADPIVRVTVVGGGGGGGAAAASSNGSDGGSSSFATSAGTATAAGGLGGRFSISNTTGRSGTDYLASGNGGEGGKTSAPSEGGAGRGGAVTVAYYNLSGISTANVTIGGGGAGGSPNGGAGGDGVVIFEYRAV